MESRRIIVKKSRKLQVIFILAVLAILLIMSLVIHYNRISIEDSNIDAIYDITNEEAAIIDGIDNEKTENDTEHLESSENDETNMEEVFEILEEEEIESSSEVASVEVVENVNITDDLESSTSIEANTHSCSYQAVYETISIEAEGYYETVTVTEAWSEEVEVVGETETICNVCDAIVSDYTREELTEHQKAHMLAGEGSGYRYDNVTYTEVIEHEAITEEVWVETQPASIENIIIGYQCSCGAWKN